MYRGGGVGRLDVGASEMENYTEDFLKEFSPEENSSRKECLSLHTFDWS